MDSKDSRPNSLESLLRKVHFTAPVMGNAALYWTCSSVLINDSLLGRSYTMSPQSRGLTNDFQMIS